MNKRQAKLQALEFAIGLLESEVDNSDEMYIEWEQNGAKVHDALQTFIDELRDRLARLEERSAK